jgi:hypothetical protein
MIFEDGLVTVGRYPDQPIQIQNMEVIPFEVGDAVINKVTGGNVFIVVEAPYKYIYARRPPPQPYYIDWFVKLDNKAEVSAAALRKATPDEILGMINGLKKTAATIDNKIKNLEKYNERALN